MNGLRPFGLALAATTLVATSALGCSDKKERRAVGDQTADPGSTAATAKSPTKSPAVDDAIKSAPPVLPPEPRGAVKGSIKFTGSAPEMPFLNNGSDAVCAQKKMRAETILVNENQTLRNVVVRVKPGTVAKRMPKGPVVVRQTDCMYRPRVQGAVAGQELIVFNGDETAHNVHVRAAQIGDRQGAEALWNRQQLKKSENLPPIREVVADHPVMRLKCDMHGWMSGYIVVSDNPYSTVTGEDGGFKLDVPAGEVVIQAWHEFYGIKEVTVTVGAGQTVDTELGFDADADNPTRSAAPTKPTPKKGT